MEHKLKTYKECFEQVWLANKRFEVRKNDRDFKVGDYLHLIEIDFRGGGLSDSDLERVPTGRECILEVKYILHGGMFGIEDGYCVMSVNLLSFKDGTDRSLNPNLNKV